MLSSLLSSGLELILTDTMDDALASLKTVPDFLRAPSFLPRISRHAGRAVEEALAPSTLFDQGVQLRGAIIEATYAAEDPAILRRLRDSSVPFLVEPQSLRFTGDAFQETAALKQLPYAPPGQVSAATLPDVDPAAFATAVLEFEQNKGCAAYISAAWPLYDRDREVWTDANRHLLQATCEANGSGDIEPRPLLAQVAPGRAVRENPEATIEALMDLPIDGVYVQPLLLNAGTDSVEKLLSYVQMLEAFEAAGVPVVAARVGAFGTVLTALGISAFDSGLGLAEACNLSSLNRKKTERERTKKGPKGSRRLYLAPLKTTMAVRQAQLILRHPALQGRFACSLGCCRFQGLDELPERSRSHFLWTRNEEVRAIRELETRSMRLDMVHEDLRGARELSRRVRRTLIPNLRDLPSFDHTDRWIRVLGREAEVRAAA
jgi:hypothetical protein